MKTKRNYSFVKASALLSGIIADVLTDMIKYQNSAIQDGIKTSTDIKGSPFKRLKEGSTLPIRNRRGHGFTPLFTMKKGGFGVSGGDVQTGKSLRATRIFKANRNNLVAKLKMLNKHGVYHNEGYTTASGSMIPGKKVPRREWFGISKEMKSGGSKHKAFMAITMQKLKSSFRI